MPDATETMRTASWLITLQRKPARTSPERSGPPPAPSPGLAGGGPSAAPLAGPVVLDAPLAGAVAGAGTGTSAVAPWTGPVGCARPAVPTPTGPAEPVCCSIAALVPPIPFPDPPVDQDRLRAAVWHSDQPDRPARASGAAVPVERRELRHRRHAAISARA